MSSINSNPSQAQAVVVAESELTYIPPKEVDESADFDQSLKDIVSEIEDEFVAKKYNFTDEELDEGEGAQEQHTPQGDPDDGGESDETGEAGESPEVTRGIERVVAREVALQAKEAEFARREAQVSNLEAELTKLRAAVPSQRLLEDLEFSPTEAFKAIGKDPETVVRLMIAEQLEAKGQEVPEELKKFVDSFKRDRRVRELERKLEERERETVAAQTFNAVVAGSREYVKTFVGDSKEALSLGKAMPILTEIAKANQDHAHLEIMEEIKSDARARMAADPNGEPITYIEAARRVEARLAKYKSMLTIGPASTAPTKQASEAQKKIPPQQKPPTAPLKPWQKKDDDIYENAVKDAEREFYKEEARARRRG